MPLSVRHVLFLTCLFLSLPSLGFDQYEPFSENGKYGLINKETREIVLAPRFEAIGWTNDSFSIYDGTIGVQQNGKWGLASVNGDQVTHQKFTVLYPFTDGLLIAGERSDFSILSKLGVINTKGREVIPLQYDQLKPNQSQLLAGTLTRGVYRFELLGKTGKVIIPSEYAAIAPIDKGIYSVTNSEKFCALFSEEGRQLTAFEFENVEPFDSQRLLVRYYNRKGLIDRNGKAVVPPVYKDIKLVNAQIEVLPFKKWTLFDKNRMSTTFQFDKVVDINGETLAVQTNDNLGIINKKEAYIAYFEDLTLLEASQGLLLVSNGTYQGVINAKGEQVLANNYDRIEIREEAIFAQIRRKDGQNWQIHNHKGVLISRQRYERFSMVTPKRIAAVKNGKTGLLDNKGVEKTPFIYDSLGEFKNGMAVVKYLGNHGVINENGYWITTPYKDSLALFDEFVFYQHGTENGLLNFNEEVIFRTQHTLFPSNNQWLIKRNLDGFLLTDRQGQELFTNAYDSIYMAHSDLAILAKDYQLSLFRPSSQSHMKVPKGTELIRKYSEDLISAKIDGQWGFISEQGRLRIANRYQEVRPFSEGLAPVKLIGKWGVIDKKETIIIQPVYDRIDAFFGGMALVEKDGLFGLVNRKGDLVLDLKYDRIGLYDKYILLEINGLFGLADRNGSIIRNTQFDQITPLDDQFFLLQKDDRYGVINFKGEDVVPVAFESLTKSGNQFLAAEPSVWIKFTLQ